MMNYGLAVTSFSKRYGCKFSQALSHLTGKYKYRRSNPAFTTPGISHMTTFSNKDFDSALYHAARPVYHEGTYELIYDYHQKKGGKFDKAADVGTGTGQAALKLADKFKSVIGTDISEKVSDGDEPVM
ncbi:hypothetical protein NQZ79_g3973 [Umbelopsis isabellina]|nr:hypothetical protein NQZ79_g3973 [Umbelopsis isabellina]